MRRRRQVDGGEDGFALLTVVVGMLSLSLVLMATLAYVTNSLPVARRGQDDNGALQAAQAGVDDYLARLTTCDSYWKDKCAAAVNSNPALTVDTTKPNPSAFSGWATVPSSGVQSPAQYHYDVVRTPDQEAGLLRVRSTGRVQRPGGKSSKRSLVVDLKKKSLLQYIYYTDHEATDPAMVMRRYPARTISVDPAVNSGYNVFKYGGVSVSQADRCNRYWYPTGTTLARSQNFTESLLASKDGGATFPDAYTANYSCDIQFAPIDTIDGPLYTKDAILLNNPLFNGVVSTRWPAGSTTPGPTVGSWYRLVSGGSAPSSAGYTPVYDPDDVTLPPSNASIKDRTDPATGGQDGCRYSGPTRIRLHDGVMDVTSPLTQVTNTGCGTVTATGISATGLSLPTNGVVFVESSSLACSGKGTAYPLDPSDVTPYSCSAGDVFLEGELTGRLTIAARNDITVTGNVTYKNGTTGADTLGLIANGDVEVYHPVSCASTPPAGFTCSDFVNMPTALSDITISAALLSVNHSFTVQNFDRGAKLGTLTVVGGIYQYFRGPVGTGGAGGTGYGKAYRYDDRLRSLPPPSFLDPVAAPWGANGYAEVKVPAGLPS